MSLVGRTITRYHIDAEIGQGRMGVVYRATDTSLDRKVALKFLPPYMGTDEMAKARFVNESSEVHLKVGRASSVRVFTGDIGRRFSVAVPLLRPPSAAISPSPAR